MTSTAILSSSVRHARTATPAPQLTRRGRLVVVLTMLALAFLALGLGRVSSQAGTDAPSRPATRAITVQPGQTLWQIARTVDPSADVRETVARILALNELDGGVLQAGQRLVVPN